VMMITASRNKHGFRRRGVPSIQIRGCTIKKFSARSRSATLRWTWPMRTRGSIGSDRLGIFKVRRRDEPSRPTVLIFRRFEFGEFFLSAIDIGFMRAAEREQFLLSTDVGFGGGEFGAFTFCRGDLRDFS